MKKTSILIILFLNLFLISAQTIDLETPILDENSGLIFYNNKLITHNDSGGETSLFEINTNTGNVSRMVSISNATNVDWEDIAQDSSFIYIGDIGNNSGSRTDLKIYKIAKTDYLNNDTVIAEIISFSYENQNDFTPNNNNNNWDAEALISYHDKLLIFSKNWENKEVNVYSIPKTSGTYDAIFESNFNSNGLITGADISNNGTIFLTGYSTVEAPFLYTISNISNNSLDIFSGTISSKITNIVPFGNQIEAIAFVASTPLNHQLFLSNEKYATTIGSTPFEFPAKLWDINIDNESNTVAIQKTDLNLDIKIYPNPFTNTIIFNVIADKFILYNTLGEKIIEKQLVKELSMPNLKKGLYYAHLIINNTTVVRKIVKD